MALTDAQKADIRYYLGYSMRFHQSDSRLEMAMRALEEDSDAETLVLADIARLKAIDLKFEAAYDRLKVMQVCDIKLAHKAELCSFRSEGRRVVGRIAATLGVPVRHDVFGSGAYSYLATWGGLVPSSANVVKQG